LLCGRGSLDACAADRPRASSGVHVTRRDPARARKETAMNEQNLIDRLRNAAQSFAREAQDEMFELISEEQCQQCCQKKNGGNVTEPELPPEP
jgi:hypothetical protein